ncbi:MAG TPA: zinc ABC transporter substrate-binding protein [Candidatus Saccharimonadales bacterium]|nr:zinc ABC transporter substrate-binding protein [Candidatus Saccharimonadales bacterium]
MKKYLFVLAGVAAMLFVVGVVVLAVIGIGNQAHKPQQLSVVAAENVWGDIAKQIGGNHVRVSSLMSDPNIDPHLYQSNAQDALAVSQADVVIVNGLGYDDFATKLLHASPNKHRTVTIAQVLHAKPTDNPHLWYKISGLPDVVRSLEQTLASEDPAHKAQYETNMYTLYRALMPLTIKESVMRMQFQGTPVAYTERVAGYMLSEANLSNKTPSSFASAIEAGDDPSPAAQSAMNTLLANKQVRVLVYNSQATSPAADHAKTIAQAAGVPVVGMTETLPKNEPSYQQWMSDQLSALQQALYGPGFRLQ